MRDVFPDTVFAPHPAPLLSPWPTAQRAQADLRPPDTSVFLIRSVAAHSRMPPKDAIWQLYDTLKDEDGKLVGYLTNNTNKCVWCIPCLDKYSTLKHAAETTNIGCHEPGPSQPRSKAMLRAEGMYPKLLSCACIRGYELVAI